MGRQCRRRPCPDHASLSPRGCGASQGQNSRAAPHSSVYLGHAHADHEHPAQARRRQRSGRHGSRSGPKGKRKGNGRPQTAACAERERFEAAVPSPGRRGRGRGVGGGAGLWGPEGGGSVERLRVRGDPSGPSFIGPFECLI